MVAYLLDTNHASPLVTTGHPLPRRVHERAAAGDTFAICVLVLTETLFGVSLLPRAAQNRAEWARLQQILTCYVPDEPDGVAAATLQLALRCQGQQLLTVDVLIATVALRYSLVLLTTDRDFAAVLALTQGNWLRLV